jgi:penicillin-binding protein activator
LIKLKRSLAFNTKECVVLRQHNLSKKLKKRTMKQMLRIGLLSGLLVVIMARCVPVRVTRTNIDQVTDLSGRWNDTDSRLVAEKMLEEIANAPWLARFQQTHLKQVQYSRSEESATEQAPVYSERKPVLIVGTIINKSHEHIEAETFIKDLERALIREGEVRIVANSIFREKLRVERAAQAGVASPETQKRLGRELGADYMLFGIINTIVDTEENNKVVFYQINLELADLETNELVWVGGKKIKKYRGKGKKVKRRYRGVVPPAA